MGQQPYLLIIVYTKLWYYMVIQLGYELSSLCEKGYVWKRNGMKSVNLKPKFATKIE